MNREDWERLDEKATSSPLNMTAVDWEQLILLTKAKIAEEGEDNSMWKARLSVYEQTRPVNRALELDKISHKFVDAVLDAVRYNGGDDPRFLLQLIFEHLTDCEAANLLTNLQKRGRGSRRRKPELYATMVVEEANKDRRARRLKAEKMVQESVPEDFAVNNALEYQQMVDDEFNKSYSSRISYGDAVDKVADRLGKGIDSVVDQLDKLSRTNPQLERIKKR